MVSDEQMKEIAARSLRRTLDDSLEWSTLRGARARNGYICNFENASLIVEKRNDEDADIDFVRFAILNGSGETVGEITSYEDGDELYELYEKAETKALSINETLQNILSHL